MNHGGKKSSFTLKISPIQQCTNTRYALLHNVTFFMAGGALINKIKQGWTAVSHGIYYHQKKPEKLSLTLCEVKEQMVVYLGKQQFAYERLQKWAAYIEPIACSAGKNF